MFSGSVADLFSLCKLLAMCTRCISIGKLNETGMNLLTSFAVSWGGGFKSYLLPSTVCSEPVCELLAQCQWYWSKVYLPSPPPWCKAPPLMYNCNREVMKKKSLWIFLIKVNWSKGDQNIHFQDFPEQSQHYALCFWKTAPLFQNPAKYIVWFLSTIVFWGDLNTYFMIYYFRWIRCSPPHHNQKLAMGHGLICPPCVHLRT